jgi:hypothetical protein
VANYQSFESSAFRLIRKNVYYGLDDPWFLSQEGLKIFLFVKMSRLALGFTQRLKQGAPAYFPPVTLLGRDVNHSFPSNVEVKIWWSYTSRYTPTWRGQEELDHLFILTTVILPLCV